MRTRGKSSLKAVRRREGGQAIVEFALTVILLMLLMFAILELSIFIYTYSVLANAAKEGVRYAIVHGADNVSPSGPSSGSASSPPCTASSTNVTNVVNQTKSFAGFSALSTSNVNVFVCYLDGDNKLNSLVQVSVSYVYRPLFGFNWPSVTVYANSAGRIVF